MIIMYILLQYDELSISYLFVLLIVICLSCLIIVMIAVTMMFDQENGNLDIMGDLLLPQTWTVFTQQAKIFCATFFCSWIEQWINSR